MNNFSNTTTYFRDSHKSNYTCISNQIINDSRLSCTAKLILIYLLSKPDTWVVNQLEVQKSLSIPRIACRKAFKELFDTGYLFRDKIHANGGYTYVYKVYEVPKLSKLSRGQIQPLVDDPIDSTYEVSTDNNIYKDNLDNISRYNKTKEMTSKDVIKENTIIESVIPSTDGLTDVEIAEIEFKKQPRYLDGETSINPEYMRTYRVWCELERKYKKVA